MRTDHKWYGLMRDGELLSVKQFSHIPVVHDFNVPLFSWAEYRVVSLSIVISELPVEESDVIQ